MKNKPYKFETFKELLFYISSHVQKLSKWNEHKNKLVAIWFFIYVCVRCFIIAGMMGYYAFNANERDKEFFYEGV